jgi:hypothetical protein
MLERGSLLLKEAGLTSDQYNQTCLILTSWLLVNVHEHNAQWHFLLTSPSLFDSSPSCRLDAYLRLLMGSLCVNLDQ